MTVYLVGAGPGDPGLLTVRAAELLGRADVVVYDRLAEAEMLDLVPAGAELVDVGKRPGAPVDQEQINRLLIERGRAMDCVVRLKGGDPFVFGRGGEEAEALERAGVPYEIVPGVTSAVAAPAYAGVPLTHRGLSTSFTVVTGHSRQSVDRDVEWDALARSGGTLVVLMGVAHRAAIAERLVAAGMSPSTPVAAVRWGTRPDQRSVRTTLGDLGAAALEPPAVIVIGAVAAMRLGWFERRPLLGHTVAVARAASLGRPRVRGKLAELLRLAGAEALDLAVVEPGPPADGGAALAAAARRAGEADWVLFTSANAVEALFAHLRDARCLKSARVAAIGPGTAGALAARGIAADLVPKEQSAEGVLEVFPAGEGRVLFPRGAEGREVLVEGLRSRGWEVELVEAYRTRPAAGLGAETVARARSAGAVCFTAASTVGAWLELVGATPPLVACIGPATAGAARAHGLDVAVVGDPHTAEGMVSALVRHVRETS